MLVLRNGYCQVELAAEAHGKTSSGGPLAGANVTGTSRTAVQESMQLSPAALMFGRELRTPVDLVFGTPSEPKLPFKPGMDYFLCLHERL